MFGLEVYWKALRHASSGNGLSIEQKPSNFQKGLTGDFDLNLFNICGAKGRVFCKNCVNIMSRWGKSNYKDVFLPVQGYPSHDHHIFNMGIFIPRKDGLYIDKGPRCLRSLRLKIISSHGIDKHKWVSVNYLCYQCSEFIEDEYTYIRINLVQQWPLLLTWFNFNPSMDK